MRFHATLSLLTALLLAATAATAMGADARKPEVRQGDDKIVLQNSDITVWFHGKKPFLQVFHTGSVNDSEVNATSAFSYKFHEVVEYRDLDGNDLPSNTEVIASLNLEKASAWEVNTSEENGTIVLNLTLEAPVKLAGGVRNDDALAIPGDLTARIALVFTISEAALPVSVGNASLTVPTTAIKYDFVVDQWPSLGAADSRLALDAIVAGDLATAETLGVSGASIGANGTDVGFLAWTDTAQGVTVDGEALDVPVVTATESLAEGDANATAYTRLVHTYDAADLASLVHDPVIGVASAEPVESGSEGDGVQNPVPGIATPLVGLAALCAALLATRRRG